MAKGMVVRVTAVLVLFIVIVGTYILLIEKSGKTVVGIIQPFQHIAVSDVTDGIVESIHKADSSVQVVIKNANGDNTTIPSIIATLRDQGVSVFVPIFTKTSQAVKANVEHTPIVFAAVTDPVQASLLSNLERPEGNITGVSDLWPIGANLATIRAVLPNAKRLGVVYDPGDPSSSVTIPLLKKECPSYGFELVLRPVTSVQELTQSLSTFIGNADVLFTANDVTVTSAFPALVAFSTDQKIPLFAGDYSSVERGAIAAVGQNYKDVGREAGRMIAAIMAGSSVQDLPVKFTTGGDLYLNRFSALRMAVSLPSDLVQKAVVVYDSISTK